MKKILFFFLSLLIIGIYPLSTFATTAEEQAIAAIHPCVPAATDEQLHCLLGTQSEAGARACITGLTHEQYTCMLTNISTQIQTNAATQTTGNDTPVQVNQFTPLTHLPGITDIGNSTTLPAFLNNIYKLCVGVAGALAVLQIIRGGLMYMVGDSGMAEKKEARNIIVMSIVGLLLVLSPVIVFSLIDPRILSLQIDFSPLKPAVGNHQGGPSGTPATPSTPSTPTDGNDSDQSDATPTDGGGEESNNEPVTGSQPIRICVPSTSDNSKRFVFASYQQGTITTTEGPQTCTLLTVEMDDSTLAQCQRRISEGGPIHTVVACEEHGAHDQIDKFVPAPLCAGQGAYTLNSSNVDGCS